MKMAKIEEAFPFLGCFLENSLKMGLIANGRLLFADG
jgi:hypothetical protein